MKINKMFKETIIKKITKVEIPDCEAVTSATGSPPLNSTIGKRVKIIAKIKEFMFIWKSDLFENKDILNKVLP